ncbi:alpha/beta fold hydrolase [Aquibacillus saliphilus]|uniref:alpha/beta fold hydrolase n=1 Tax=Aquibacillus saliphilus TaxID=1909422 RepID=UPI001CF00CF9|nr:alpha/beta hydrolase [Aquibacillus saliphilus]
MTDIETKMIQTGDYKTHVIEGGDKSSETIIFLHGSGPGVTGKSNWQHVLPAFAANFHVVAPDFYGFGRTDHPDVPPNNGVEWLRARIDQITTLMDEMEIDKAHLVGNSLGGVISLHLIMQAPKKFDKIILMGAGGGKFEPTPELMKLQNFHKDPDPASFQNLLSWFLFDDSTLENELEEVVKERLELFLKPEVRKSYEATFTNATLADLAVPPSAMKRMKNEFLLLHGKEDRFVPLESSLYMMDYIPNGQLHVFKRCGHWVQIEQKDRFVKLTNDFFLGEL